jgi:hypothetical protein
VKVYRGSPGIPQVAGHARARWSSGRSGRFPSARSAKDSGDPAGWTAARKRPRTAGSHRPPGRSWRAPELGQEPRCKVELTEVRMGGQDWWTLGFEATGPADLLRSELQATAALVFDQACPAVCNPARMNPGSVSSEVAHDAPCPWSSLSSP